MPAISSLPFKTYASFCTLFCCLMNSIFCLEFCQFLLFFYFLSLDTPGTHWRRRSFYIITFTWLTFTWDFLISMDFSSSFPKTVVHLMLKIAHPVVDILETIYHLLHSSTWVLFTLYLLLQTGQEYRWTSSFILLLLPYFSYKIEDPQI